MKSQAQAVVIGGGVVGASVLYHLAEAGWTDIVMLERNKLLQMTSLRDQRIWSAARGEDLPAEIDDSSTVEIPATFPGKRGGTSPALTPAEERAKFEIAEGFQVELFASEQEFPDPLIHIDHLK